MGEQNLVLRKLAGGYQFVIERPGQLRRLSEIDDALWVATSVPADSLHADPAFLRYVDTDANGRLRSDEIREAVRWLLHVLSDRSHLLEGTEVLLLSSIDTSHEEGQALRAAAERVLSNLGQPESDRITLAQVRDRQQIMSHGAANGDGVIPPDSVDDPEVAGFIRDVVATVGGEADASGEVGVTEAALERFVTEARSFLDWLELGSARGGEESSVLVWGADTQPAYEALSAVRGKLDEYFVLCAACRLNEGVAEAAGLSDEALTALDTSDAAAVDERIRLAPLAKPTPHERLALDERINPAYRSKLRRFAEVVLPRADLAKVGELLREEWEALKAEFVPYMKWQESKGGATVEVLGEAKLRSYVDGPLPALVSRIVEDDKAVASELAKVRAVERAILYQRWLLPLVNNTVSLAPLFDPDSMSMVEAGTLVMGGRRYGLTMRVTNRAEHKQTAQLSCTYLLYLEIASRHGGDERFEVSVAVTSGASASLRAGKRGVFFTPDGREWDARVIEVITNPIDLWEAITLPFKRMGEFIVKQVERFSSSSYEQVEGGLGKDITAATQTLSPGAPPAAQPTRSGMARDLLIGGGVAAAGLGGTFAIVIKTLSTISWWRVFLGALGLLAVILLPITALAIWKLRRRDIGVLLEACGWAVNPRIRLSNKLGRLFSYVPAAPGGASRGRRDLVDNFLRRVPERRGRELLWMIVMLLVGAAALALGLILRHWLGRTG